MPDEIAQEHRRSVDSGPPPRPISRKSSQHPPAQRAASARFTPPPDALAGQLARVVLQRRPPAGAPTQWLARAKQQLTVSGNQFGETYHIALAMIMSKLAGRSDIDIAPRWLTSGEGEKTPTNAAQKAFLTKVHRWLNRYDAAEIEEIGRSQATSEVKSLNEGSGLVGELVKGAVDWTKLDDVLPTGINRGNGNLPAALVFLKRVFLTTFDLGVSRSEQKPAAVQARNAAMEQQVLAALDQRLNVGVGGVRNAPQRYVIFNRQQTDGPERNLTSDIVRCIIECAQRTHHVAQFLFVNRTGDPIPWPDDAGNATFIDIGPEVMTNTLPPGYDKYTYQLNVFRILHQHYGVLRNIGMKSGAVDGPAMLGIPTVYFDTTTTGRLTGLIGHLGMKRVDISGLGNEPGALDKTPPKSRRQLELRDAAWKASVVQQLDAALA